MEQLLARNWFLTYFIDERDGTKYYVTRYDPQPAKNKPETSLSSVPPTTLPIPIAKAAPFITELEFGTNDKLRYLGPRAFGYLHNLEKMNLVGCANLKIPR